MQRVRWRRSPAYGSATAGRSTICPPDVPAAAWRNRPAIPAPPLPGKPASRRPHCPANYLTASPVHGPIVIFNDSYDSRGTRVTGRTYADGSVIIETP